MEVLAEMGYDAVILGRNSDHEKEVRIDSKQL
jgi:hypothetical protein